MKQVTIVLLSALMILVFGLATSSLRRGLKIRTHSSQEPWPALTSSGEVAPPPAVSPPDPTHTQAAAGGLVRQVDSTAYCEDGPMAGGKRTFEGAVAMNGVPFRTKFWIRSGPLKGKLAVVEDRIGCCSDFDIFMSSCSAARKYGRRTILIEELG